MPDTLKVAVIDYGMGNLMSVFRAWQYVGGDARIISAPEQLDTNDILVFPGQGAIVDTMKLLKRTGFDELLRFWIGSDKPFFGICLGMQALFESSEEGNCDCLGIFKGRVRKLTPPREFKVPHMGWDNVDFTRGHADYMLEGINPSDQFYFVHSYYLDTKDRNLIFGQTEYGGTRFTSAIARGNLVATQFHPEKSQAKGLLLYKNYLAMQAGKKSSLEKTKS